MLPSGWVTPARAPAVKSFQSKSGLVRVASARNLFSGWYQPAFQKRFFSTCSEVKKASIPPEFAVISTVIFCRAWISGSVSHFTRMPESDSNSGMCFSSTSMNGCFVRSRNSSLPWKRFQLKPCARAGVHTKGPAATPAATACRKVRREHRRVAMDDLLLSQIVVLVDQLRGIDAHALADQPHRRLQLAVHLGVFRIAATVEAHHRTDDPLLEVEAEELATLGSATEHEAVPIRRVPDILDGVLVLIRPEGMDVVVGLFCTQHRSGRGTSLLVSVVPVLHAQAAEDRM